MRQQRAFLPDPAGICGLVIFLVLTAFAGTKALQDGDTLWHIKMGQVMLERGEILQQDLFSHTAYGQPWLAHEWLSEIVMAVLHGWAGLPGVAIFYFAIVGLTFTLVFQTASRLAGDAAAIAAVFLALPFALMHLLARPHLFTWLGAVVTIHLLEGGGRRRWLLLPCYILWANLHGGVLFGLALQAIFIAGNLLDRFWSNQPKVLLVWWREHRDAILLFGACTLAVAINPFGFRLYLFPFDVASPIFVQEIGEWRSPNFQKLWYARAWFIALLGVALLFGRNLAWRWKLLLLFIAWQALGHVRHLSMAALLLAPCFACYFGELFSKRRLRRTKPANRDELILSPWTGPLATLSLLFLFIAFSATSHSGPLDRFEEKFRLPESYSQEALEFLSQGFPSGNLLNDYEWGDYLLYGLEAPPKVFIDGRADMYGEQIFSDYLKMARLEKETDSLIEKYQINWVIFPKDHLLVRHLRGCNDWDLLYEDNVVTVLNRSFNGAEMPAKETIYPLNID